MFRGLSCVAPLARRLYSAAAPELKTSGQTTPLKDLERLGNLRNIGISAHIDSGKTTLTERILYYTGRISSIHDVRGKDGVGATMDYMELEREKGITIQSAATFCQWQDKGINIIDTPGHVDFTIEVERALRVLDGAVLVLCSVGGVQSQTQTVDRQMKRYGVPRISFINKMDRTGSNPFKVVQQLRQKLSLACAPLQYPIMSEDGDEFLGVVDLLTMEAIYNRGDNGENVVREPCPDRLKSACLAKRQELVEQLAEVDDAIGEKFIMEEDCTVQELRDAIRRATISCKFSPVFMGSAFKNTAVQPLLDAVIDYLPNPSERVNHAFETDKETKKEEKVDLVPSSEEPLVGLAFKLEDTKYGQLTYIRVYQGTLEKGMFIQNMRTPNGKKVKVSKLVRMHSNEMEEVQALPAGEIGAMFGVECASGDTFTAANSTRNLTLSSMFIPDPVVSLSLRPKNSKDVTGNFSKALQKFCKEDPTFRVHTDSESKETIISGMGELHLEIYVERMKREYGVECVTGRPRVAYRETIMQKVPFDYTHKKQSGGAGQFGKIMGFIEPLKPENENGKETDGFVLENEFVDETTGLNIPSQYIPSVEKGFNEGCEKGRLIGHKVVGVRFVLQDGAAHSVDSSDLAFRQAAIGAFRQAVQSASPVILEPIMDVSISVPQEFQASIMTQINKRKGAIYDTSNEGTETDGWATLRSKVSLKEMFGYVSDLRAATQGKGEFTMEFSHYQTVMRNEQEDLMKEYQKELEAKKK